MSQKTLYYLDDFKVNGKRQPEVLANLVQRYRKGIPSSSAPQAAKKFVSRIYRSNRSDQVKKPTAKTAVKFTINLTSVGRSKYTHVVDLKHELLSAPHSVTRGDKTFEISTATSVTSHEKSKHTTKSEDVADGGTFF